MDSSSGIVKEEEKEKKQVIVIPRWYLQGKIAKRAEEEEKKKNNTIINTTNYQDYQLKLHQFGSKYILSNDHLLFRSSNPLITQFVKEHVLTKKEFPTKQEGFTKFAILGEAVVYQTLAPNYFVVKTQKQQHIQYQMKDNGLTCIQIFWCENYNEHTPVVFFIPSLTAHHAHFTTLIQDIVDRLKWIVCCVNTRFHHCPSPTPLFHICGSDEDVDYVFHQVKALFPTSPFFILGVSMGGSIATRYLGKYKIGPDKIVAGATICSPLAGQDVKIDNPMFDALLMKTIRDLYVEPCKKMFFEQPNRVGVERYIKFQKAKTSHDLVYTNGEMFLEGTREDMDRIYDGSNFIHNLQIPLLMITSDDDEIVTSTYKTQSSVLNSAFSGLLHTKAGQHCIYRNSAGTAFSTINWAERVALDFFEYVYKQYFVSNNK